MKLYTTLYLKAILACTALMCLLSTTANAQAGIYDDYIILDTTTYFVVGNGLGIPGAPNFTGTHLGYYQVGDTLSLKGGDQFTYKTNATGNICNSHLHYSIYPVGGAIAAFVSVNLPFSFNYNFPTTTNQLWKTTSDTVNILSGLTPGEYEISLYFSAVGSDTSSTLCSTAFYASNNGNNYSATFTVGTTPFDTTYTSAAAFGPFCAGSSDNITVPFTTSGGYSGHYHVQISDSSGVFPANDSSNLIGHGDTSGVAAVIPDTLPAGSGYRVRVIQDIPAYTTTGDNGSNIVIRPNTPSSLVIEANNTSICAGQPVTFTADSIINGGNAPQITFYVNGDSAGTGGTFIHAFSTIQPVYAVLTSSAQCVSSSQSSSISVTVYPNPSTTTYDTICAGDSILLYGHYRSHTGAYADTIAATMGCDTINTVHLTILAAPRHTIYDTICPGSAYTFNGHTLAAPGTYSDTVTNAHGCDSIIVLALAMYPLPVPVIIEHHAVPYDTLSTGQFSSYLWLLNLSPVAGATGETYLPTAPGHYTVVVTSSHGCQDTAGINVLNTTGIQSISAPDINVYPNPAQNILYVSTPASSDIATMTMADEMGRIVYTMTVIQSAALMQVDISTLANGIYVLSVKDKNNQSAYRQIVIAR